MNDIELKRLLDKANDLAVKQKAEFGTIDPMSIEHVLSVYFHKATFDECHEAAMQAYIANQWTPRGIQR